MIQCFFQSPQVNAPSDMDTFLSNVIIRNRPRVVLFSPKPHPSLTVKLVALARHTTIDFGFVSTQQRGASRAFLRRFGVTPGEKQLLVFKEYQEPELSVEVSAWFCCLVTSMQAILHVVVGVKPVKRLFEVHLLHVVNS